jgi:hypothetical protein
MSKQSAGQHEGSQEYLQEYLIEGMLQRFESFPQRFADHIGKKNQTICARFSRCKEVLSEMEYRNSSSQGANSSYPLIMLWRKVLSDEIRFSQLSGLEINRLCAVPQIAMSQLFIFALQREEVTLTERGLIGLVHSYHQEWGDMLNRFGAVELIRTCLSKFPEEKSSRLISWRANLRVLVDPNDVDHLSFEMVSTRLAPQQAASRFSIAEDSAFMSAVVATAVRRISQRFRPLAEDYEYLAKILQAYQYFRPRDLGRALTSAILISRRAPPEELRRAINQLGQSNPALGPFQENRAKWQSLLDERAVAVFEGWIKC